MTNNYRSPISLLLYDRLLSGNGQRGDVTQPFKTTWRRSKARLGGCKIGSVNLTTADFTPREMEEMFRFGLLREIREYGGGRQTWQGIITHMEWTHAGDVYTIDLTNLSNARRALYRRLFDNLLTNGSAESGAWSAYNSATVTQSLEWVADGAYSCKIVVADAVKRGAFIQTGIPILAGVVYTFSARLSITAGSWVIEAYRSDTDARLVRWDSASQLGEVIATFSIPESNTYSGNIYIRVSSVDEAGAATCYVDAAIFKPADAPSDTGWQLNANSIRTYGRKETIDLWGGMSYQAANARVAGDLLDTAWPRPDVPGYGSTRHMAIDPREDKLSIVFAGYWLTLNWLYTRLGGTASASSLVSALVGYQTDYVSAGKIASNTLQFTIESSSPLRVGDVLKEIASTGQTGGGLWSIGIWSDRLVDYQPVSDELAYHLRGGHLLSTSEGDVEPWLARPGWAQVDDLPIGPEPISTAARHNARWRYLEEIEMLPPDAQHPDYWLAYSREAT